jgi:hypothetical protein
MFHTCQAAGQANTALVLPSSTRCNSGILNIKHRPRTDIRSHNRNLLIARPHFSVTMCQLCQIKTIASRDRWPKPLEHNKADLEFLVTAAHDEWSKWKADEKVGAAPESLLDLVRLVNSMLAEIEEQRLKWWTSPEKREQRRKLEMDDCNQKKLSQLHAVNNKMVEMIEGMNAKVGVFVKWTLGMNGGVWELV